MRGHLIFRFKVGICRLDTRATAAVVGGGYDTIMREPKKVAVAGRQVGVSSRREKTEVILPCQVKHAKKKDLNMAPGGHADRTTTVFVLHFRDLEAAGLVSGGDVQIGVGDRINALYDLAGNVIESYANPPGLFVEQARPISYGLFRVAPRRNLLELTTSDRVRALS